jgi:hypothetical protein
MISLPLFISQAYALVRGDIRGQRRKSETADPTSRARRSERRSESDLDVVRWRYKLMSAMAIGVDIQSCGKGCTK